MLHKAFFTDILGAIIAQRKNVVSPSDPVLLWEIDACLSQHLAYILFDDWPSPDLLSPDWLITVNSVVAAGSVEMYEMKNVMFCVWLTA